MYTYSCFPCTTCRCSLQFFHAALQWVTNLLISYNWHQLIYLIHLFIFAHMCFCMYSCICVFPNLCIYCFSPCMIIFDYLYINFYTHTYMCFLVGIICFTFWVQPFGRPVFLAVPGKADQCSPDILNRSMAHVVCHNSNQKERKRWFETRSPTGDFEKMKDSYIQQFWCNCTMNTLWICMFVYICI